MKQLLFITHDASRSGAPILLFNLIKWCVEHKSKSYKITLLVVNDGPLVIEYQKYVNVKILNYKNSTRFGRLNSYLDKKHKKNIIKDLNIVNWELIFSNTIVNGMVIKMLNNSTTPIVSYVHELEFSINHYNKKGHVEGTLLHSDFFICGSHMVKNNLIETHGINPLKLHVVNSFAELKSNSKDIIKANEIKAELDIPSDALVVGMMGNLHWRKGPEFFIETATKLSSENIFFLWVGASNIDYLDRLYHDIKTSKKKINIKFIPPTPEFYKYFHLIDLFFLSSREDPYPMVIIEATSYGIPVICFENAGGAQEFIDTNVGFVVPYGDTDEAAKKIQFLHNNRYFFKENCTYIKDKSIKRHDVDTNAPRIFDIIEKLIQN